MNAVKLECGAGVVKLVVPWNDRAAVTLLDQLLTKPVNERDTAAVQEAVARLMRTFRPELAAGRVEAVTREPHDSGLVLSADAANWSIVYWHPGLQSVPAGRLTPKEFLFTSPGTVEKKSVELVQGAVDSLAVLGRFTRKLQAYKPGSMRQQVIVTIPPDRQGVVSVIMKADVPCQQSDDWAAQEPTTGYWYQGRIAQFVVKFEEVTWPETQLVAMIREHADETIREFMELPARKSAKMNQPGRQGWNVNLGDLGLKFETPPKPPVADVGIMLPAGQFTVRYFPNGMFDTNNAEMEQFNKWQEDVGVRMTMAMTRPGKSGTTYEERSHFSRLRQLLARGLKGMVRNLSGYEQTDHGSMLASPTIEDVAAQFVAAVKQPTPYALSELVQRIERWAKSVEPRP